MKRKLLFILVIVLVVLAVALMLQYMWFSVEHHSNKTELLLLALGALLATPWLLLIRKYTD